METNIPMANGTPGGDSPAEPVQNPPSLWEKTVGRLQHASGWVWIRVKERPRSALALGGCLVLLGGIGLFSQVLDRAVRQEGNRVRAELEEEQERVSKVRQEPSAETVEEPLRPTFVQVLPGTSGSVQCVDKDGRVVEIQLGDPRHPVWKDLGRVPEKEEDGLSPMAGLALLNAGMTLMDLPCDLQDLVMPDSRAPIRGTLKASQEGDLLFSMGSAEGCVLVTDRGIRYHLVRNKAGLVEARRESAVGLPGKRLLGYFESMGGRTRVAVDMEEGLHLITPAGHKSFLFPDTICEGRKLCLSPDGRRLLLSDGSALVLVDLASGRFRHLPVPSSAGLDTQVASIALLGDRSALACMEDGEGLHWVDLGQDSSELVDLVPLLSAEPGVRPAP